LGPGAHSWLGSGLPSRTSSRKVHLALLGGSAATLRIVATIRTLETIEKFQLPGASLCQPRISLGPEGLMEVLRRSGAGRPRPGRGKRLDRTSLLRRRLFLRGGRRRRHVVVG